MPYCTNCGTEEREGQQFCGVCGARKRGAFGSAPMPPVSFGAYGTGAQVRVGISLVPPRQSRWSILFRVLLMLPLGVVFVVVAFAAAVVTFVAWFCALFVGRVPDGQQHFLSNALRVYGNILSYGYLLSSRWPGLTFNAKPGDQVSIDIDHVGLRRWSVFFRLVLGFPASLVGVALNFGVYPLLLVAWVWGVVAGREPRSIHQALALVLRYQLRLQAYSTLLTPTQPFLGFLGDGNEVPLNGSEVAGATPSSTGTGASSVDPVTVERPSVAPAAASLSTRWFVTKAAKVLVVLVLGAGALLYFLAPSFENPLIVRLQDSLSRGTVTASHTAAVNAMRRFETASNNCRGVYAPECEQRAATRANARLSTQSSLLRTNNVFVPSGALTSVTNYESAMDSLENELFAVQASSSLSSQLLIVKNEIPTTLARLNRDYRVVEARLGA